MIYDLELLLDEVIKEYGENKEYHKPRVSWSNFNQLNSFGVYHYWENSIEISPFLNDKRISRETLKSVIYHEYLHQLYSVHDNRFQKKENLFLNFEEHKKILEEYFAAILEWPSREIRTNIEHNNDMVFCLLSVENTEEYLPPLKPSNFNCYIDLGRNTVLPDKFSNKEHDVIWLVRDSELLLVAGISKDVTFLKERQNISLEPLYTDRFYFQAIAESDKTSFFWETPCSIEYNLFPQEFELGIIHESDIKNFLVSDVIENINSYDRDLHGVGITKSASQSIAPIVENDYKKIIKLAYKEKELKRAIWIANKGKLLCDCFETRLCLADCLMNGLIFDAAIEEYTYLKENYPDNKEVNKRLNIAKSLLERFY